MKVENGKFCPLIKKDCVGLQCTWMIHLRGANPQTGEELDEWDCAVKWLPMLLIENAKEVRQGAAATESFRNEMVRAHDETMHAAKIISQPTTNRLKYARDNYS